MDKSGHFSFPMPRRRRKKSIKKKWLKIVTSGSFRGERGESVIVLFFLSLFVSWGCRENVHKFCIPDLYSCYSNYIYEQLTIVSY